MADREKPWDLLKWGLKMSDDKYEKTIEELKAEVERRSHPAAKIFMLIADKADEAPEAWQDFCADIRSGLRFPIVIDKNSQILDGRSRYLACLATGTEPKFQVVNVEGAAAVAFVISANLHRRHDDPSVRAMQIVKLREMLKMANLPSPPLNAAADAGGVSYKTARNAHRVHREDPELAKQVQDGKLSVNAAKQILDMAPGPEQDKVKKEVATAKNKKEAKGIVGERKKTKKKQQQLGSLKMPGLTGAYSTLLAVLENVPRLPNELRKLRDDPNPLSVQHARELRAGIEGVKTLDTEELLTAADVAVRALDRIIAKGHASVKQDEPAERSDDPADAMADVEQEAA
jgi:hypothetical protein